MFKLFGFQGNRPASIPTDQVVPMRYFDDTFVFRAIVLHTMFVFNEVLDTQKLHDSLEALVERDGWRILGARLRRNTAGKLEYHIPLHFTRDRPAIRYSHLQYPMPISDHPLASQLPKSGSKLESWVDAERFHVLSHSPNCPRSLEDYLHNDDPQLGLHIVSFNDATLVSLNWPHTLFDGMGKAALLDAWMLMLQGRPNEVPATYPVDEDPLKELGSCPPEPHRLNKSLMSMFDLVCYGLRNLRLLISSSQLERRVIHIPATYLTAIREAALQDLKSSNPDEEQPFLSEGDILTALWARVSTSHLVNDPNRLVTVVNAQSLRPALSGDLLSFSSAYISNAVQLVSVLINAADLLTKPLGFAALRIRQSIKDLGKRGQMESFAALWRASPYGAFPMFGNSAMYLISCSNWSKARLYEVDFSNAIVNCNVATSKTSCGVGRPSLVYHGRFCPEGLIGENTLVIIGKDEKGNYWLDGSAKKDGWDRIETLLGELCRD